MAQVGYNTYKETQKNTTQDYHIKYVSALSYIYPEEHNKISEMIHYLTNFHSIVLSTDRTELDTKILNYDEFVSRLSLITRLLHRYCMNDKQAMKIYTTFTTEIILTLLQSTTQPYRTHNLLTTLISCANTSKLVIQQLLPHLELFIHLIEKHKWKILKLFSILISSHDVYKKLTHILTETILSPTNSTDKAEKFIHLSTVYLRYIDEPDFILNSLCKLYSMLGNGQFDSIYDSKDEEILICLLQISKKIECNENNFTMISDIAHCMPKCCIISVEATKLIQKIINIIIFQSRSFTYFSFPEIIILLNSYAFEITENKSLQYKSILVLIETLLENNLVDELNEITSSKLIHDINIDFQFNGYQNQIIISKIDFLIIKSIINDKNVSNDCDISEFKLFQFIEECEVPLDIFVFFDFDDPCYSLISLVCLLGYFTSNEDILLSSQDYILELKDSLEEMIIKLESNDFTAKFEIIDCENCKIQLYQIMEFINHKPLEISN